MPNCSAGTTTIASGVHRLASALPLAALGLLLACRAETPSAVELHSAMQASAAPAFELSLSAEDRQLLAQIRAATAQYHDVDRAVADGYVREPVCAAIATGAMGVHYPNTALIGFVPGVLPRTGTDPNIDPLRPDVLVYEPQPSGRMRLVAVEYMVFQAAWQAAHPEQPVPSMFGVPFDLRTHGWKPHYELHLWLWRENPNGLTAEWNPKVECL